MADQEAPSNVVSLELVRQSRGVDVYVGGVLQRGDCAHMGVFLVDESDHSIYCKACKKQLDPWWCVATFARRDRRLMWEYKNAREAFEKTLARAQALLVEFQGRVTPHRIIRLEKLLETIEAHLRQR